MREQVLAGKMGVIDDPFGNKAHCLVCRSMGPAAGFSVCSRCSNVRPLKVALEPRGGEGRGFTETHDPGGIPWAMTDLTSWIPPW